jgi:hypothetical protein
MLISVWHSRNYTNVVSGIVLLCEVHPITKEAGHLFCCFVYIHDEFQIWILSGSGLNGSDWRTFVNILDLRAQIFAKKIVVWKKGFGITTMKYDFIYLYLLFLFWCVYVLEEVLNIYDCLHNCTRFETMTLFRHFRFLWILASHGRVLGDVRN